MDRRRTGRQLRPRHDDAVRPRDPEAASVGCTGPAPRRRRTGPATWTAPCARASGPPARSWSGCRDAAAGPSASCWRSSSALLPASGADRERWDTRVFAAVQEPGLPGVRLPAPQRPRLRRHLHQPAGRPRSARWCASGPPAARCCGRGGCRDQNLDEDHGVQVANADARGRLVLLERSTSSVRTLNIRNGHFRRWATLPDLPICSTGERPCSPNVADGPAIPNYAAWGPGGALFVTDYGQAVIWRIPRRTQKPRCGSPPASRRVGVRDRRARLPPAGPDPADHAAVVHHRRQRPDRREALLPADPGVGPPRHGCRRCGPRSPATSPTASASAAPAGSTSPTPGCPSRSWCCRRRGRELERFPEVPGPARTGRPSRSTRRRAPPSTARASWSPTSRFFGNTEHHAILDVEVGERGRRPYLPRTAFWR